MSSEIRRPVARRGAFRVESIEFGETLQERKGERYRLRIVVDELRKATAEDYRTGLLAFINCLVISTPVLKDRIRIRNEFIGWYRGFSTDRRTPKSLHVAMHTVSTPELFFLSYRDTSKTSHLSAAM